MSSNPAKERGTMPANSTLTSLSMPGAAIVGVGSPRQVEGRRRRIVSSSSRAGTAGGEHLLDRFTEVGTPVPIFSAELARARRAAATLREENRSLLETVRKLQRERDTRW
jgi:hypothetical protein